MGSEKGNNLWKEVNQKDPVFVASCRVFQAKEMIRLQNLNWGMLDTLQGKFLMQRDHCMTLGINGWARGVLRTPEFVCKITCTKWTEGIWLFFVFFKGSTLRKVKNQF